MALVPTYRKGNRQPDTSQQVKMVDWGGAVRQGMDAAMAIDQAKSNQAESFVRTQTALAKLPSELQLLDARAAEARIKNQIQAEKLPGELAIAKMESDYQQTEDYKTNFLLAKEQEITQRKLQISKTANQTFEANQMIDANNEFNDTKTYRDQVTQALESDDLAKSLVLDMQGSQLLPNPKHKDNIAARSMIKQHINERVGGIYATAMSEGKTEEEAMVALVTESNRLQMNAGPENREIVKGKFDDAIATIKRNKAEASAKSEIEEITRTADSMNISYEKAAELRKVQDIAAEENVDSRIFLSAMDRVEQMGHEEGITSEEALEKYMAENPDLKLRDKEVLTTQISIRKAEREQRTIEEDLDHANNILGQIAEDQVEFPNPILDGISESDLVPIVEYNNTFTASGPRGFLHDIGSPSWLQNLDPGMRGYIYNTSPLSKQAVKLMRNQIGAMSAELSTYGDEVDQRTRTKMREQISQYEDDLNFFSATAEGMNTAEWNMSDRAKDIVQYLDRGRQAGLGAFYSLPKLNSVSLEMQDYFLKEWTPSRTTADFWIQKKSSLEQLDKIKKGEIFEANRNMARYLPEQRVDVSAADLNAQNKKF